MQYKVKYHQCLSKVTLTEALRKAEPGEDYIVLTVDSHNVRVPAYMVKQLDTSKSVLLHVFTGSLYLCSGVIHHLSDSSQIDAYIGRLQDYLARFAGLTEEQFTASLQVVG